jgi:hypothetical protein
MVVSVRDRLYTLDDGPYQLTMLSLGPGNTACTCSMINISHGSSSNLSLVLGNLNVAFVVGSLFATLVSIEVSSLLDGYSRGLLFAHTCRGFLQRDWIGWSRS